MSLLPALALGSLVGAASARAPRCAAYGPGRTVAELSGLAVTESSGLAASRQRPGVLYTHDDSGGPAVLHAITTEGTVLGGHPLPRGWNNDWEALEAAPCPKRHGVSGAASCLYVGDLGDNRGRRPRVVVRVVEEPKANAGVGTALTLLETWRLVYPDGAQDAEALLVHPKTGSVDVLTKRLGAASRLFRVPALSATGSDQPLEPLGTLPVTAWADDPLVTGAAWNPDGDTVVVRTYTTVGVWTVDPCAPDGWWDRPPDQVFAAPPSRQGESIAIGPKGRIFSTSEGHPMPLFVQDCLDPAPFRGCGSDGPSLPPAAPPPNVEAVPEPASAPTEPPQTGGCATHRTVLPGSGAGLLALCGPLLWARRRHTRPRLGQTAASSGFPIPRR